MQIKIFLVDELFGRKIKNLSLKVKTIIPRGAYSYLQYHAVVNANGFQTTQLFSPIVFPVFVSKNLLMFFCLFEANLDALVVLHAIGGNCYGIELIKEAINNAWRR